MACVKKSCAQNFCYAKAVLALEVQDHWTIPLPVYRCLATVIRSKTHACKREIEVAEGPFLALQVALSCMGPVYDHLQNRKD